AYDDGNHTVRAARLRAMLGSAVDAQMPLGVGQGGRPRIAYDGQDALVVWTGVSGGIQGRRIRPLDGSFVDAQPVPLVSSSPLPMDHDIALAFDGKAYVFADLDLLTTVNAVRVARFTPSLASLDPPARLLLSNVAPDNGAVALGVGSNSEV